MAGDPAVATFGGMREAGEGRSEWAAPRKELEGRGERRAGAVAATVDNEVLGGVASLHGQIGQEAIRLRRPQGQGAKHAAPVPGEQEGEAPSAEATVAVVDDDRIRHPSSVEVAR